MIGIIYNTTMVAEDDPSLGSWKLMWDERHAGNILQFNNSRDAFGSAQYFLGLDVNSDSEEEWRKALDKLKEQKPILQGYVMDEIFNKMENGSAGIAAYYAGDYLSMYENNNDLEFFYPEEGTNLYVDAMCIPKSSKNKELAERYINFMLMEEPAIANAEYTYYASPNRLVVESEEYIEYMGEIKEDAYEKMYATDEVKTSTYKNLSGEKLILINELWEELKSDIEISAGIYAICGVIIVTLLSLGIYFGVRNKIRNNY
jgi:spermidine/putrescine transport system substrate-binding protein